MSINLSIRNYTLTIGGLNVTSLLVGFDGADSKLSEGEGLVSFTGSVRLKKPIGFGESLDDRANTRWDRGNPVLITVADSTGTLRPPPRGGGLRIISSAYDRTSRQLEIQVGDHFALLRYREPIGDKSGVCLGSSVPVTTVINNLLTAAECPTCIDTVPGILRAPQPKLLRGSYIDQAAQIAAGAGYFLYVDSLGQVRAAQINLDAPTAFAIDIRTGAVSVDRLGGEQPPSRVTVVAQYPFLRRSRNSSTTQSTEYGPFSLVGGVGTQTIVIKESQTTDRFLRAAKKRQIEIASKEPVGLLLPEDPLYKGRTNLIDSELVRETYYYETNNRITPSGGNCEQGNQGRLYQHVVETWRTKAVVFREIYSTYPTGFTISGKLDLTLAERVITDYDYAGLLQVQLPSPTDDPDLQDEAPPELVEGLTKITRTFEPIGAVVPEEFEYQSEDWLNDFTYLVESDRLNQRWRETEADEWQQIDKSFQALARAYPEVADNLRQSYEEDDLYLAPDSLAGLISTGETRITSNSGGAQPPAPDSYPPAYSVEDKTIKARVRLPQRNGAEFAAWNRELNFEYLIGDDPQAAATALAKTWGGVLWGRYKGHNYTTNLGDDWWDYTPLCRVDVVEEDGNFATLAEGFSIAMGENRCVVGVDTLLLGSIPSVNAIPTPLYRKVFSFQAASGGAVKFRQYPYSRTPATKTIQVASGGAVKTTRVTRQSFEVASGGAIRIFNTTPTSSSLIANMTGTNLAGSELWMYYSATLPPEDLNGITRTRYVEGVDFTTGALNLTSLLSNGNGFYVFGIYQPLSETSTFWTGVNFTLNSGAATATPQAQTDTAYGLSAFGVTVWHLEITDFNTSIEVTINVNYGS